MKKTTKIVAIVLSIVLCVALLGIGTFVYASETAKKNSIGLDAAIDVAMSDAGCAEENTIIQKARRTMEDGIFVYDIEFVSSGYEYDYLLKASDGTILEKDKDKEAILADTKTPTDNTANTQTSQAATTETVKADITLEEAKKIALKDAGVSEANVNITKTKKDHDDGRSYYDIEFYTNSYEYEYEISLSGKIFSSEKDPFRKVSTGNNNGKSNNGSSNSGKTNSESKISNSGSSGNSDSGNSGSSKASNSGVTLEKAKEIALKDAGISAKNATFTKAKKDYDDDDDDVTHYDIEFYTDSNKYEYEISLKGTILSVDKDPRKNNNSGSSNNTANTGSSSSSQQAPDETKYIGIDKAKSIALNHAGVSASNVKFTKAKLEEDDGRVIYEIEFRKDYFEYEYDIDAKTGKILSTEKDD